MKVIRSPMNYRLNLFCMLSAGMLCANGNQNDPYADYASSQDYQGYTSYAQSYDASMNDPAMYGTSQTEYEASESGPSEGLYRFLPGMAVYEYLGPMSAKHGQGHATLSNLNVRLPFVKATSGSWAFNVDGTARVTWFDGDRDALMDVDTLYTFWLNLSASYKVRGSTYITAGVNPEFSSDLDSWVARNFNLGGHLLVSTKVNDHFKFTAGVAYAPQLADWPVFPFLGFSWKASRNWTVEMQGVRLSAMNKVTDYFSWGPFVSVVSGSWVVKHNYGHARYEWRSGVAGVATELGLGTWGKAKAKLVADVGFSFANSGRFKTTNGKHDLETKHYDPGFYVRAGLRFVF